jgi:hypothetical protein
MRQDNELLQHSNFSIRKRRKAERDLRLKTISVFAIWTIAMIAIGAALARAGWL